MEHKFKIGDKVRCIRPDDCFLKAGHVYEVNQLGFILPSSGPEIFIDNRSGSWMESRFELAERVQRKPIHVRLLGVVWQLAIASLRRRHKSS